MHGQLYRRHTNATALFSSPVVSVLGLESGDPGSSRDMREKKCELRFKAWLNLYIIYLHCMIFATMRCIVLILVSVMFLNIIFSIFLNQVSISSEERSTGSLPR